MPCSTGVIDCRELGSLLADHHLPTPRYLAISAPTAPTILGRQRLGGTTPPWAAAVEVGA